MSALVKSDDYSTKEVQIIKETYFKGATNEELVFFLHVCKKTGLDPLMKQVYPVKRWDSKLKKEVMTIQTSIDGYRLIAERTGKYIPGREPTFTYDNSGKLRSATAYIKKLAADGSWHEVAATAFYDEYVQLTKEGNPTQFWQKMAHNQLAKCAESLVLRRSFPCETSSVYTKEEMSQATPMAVEDINVAPIDLETGEMLQTTYSISNVQDVLGIGTETEIEDLVKMIAIKKKAQGWDEQKVICSIMEDNDAFNAFKDMLTKRLERAQNVESTQE